MVSENSRVRKKGGKKKSLSKLNANWRDFFLLKKKNQLHIVQLLQSATM
jgi:hypothetical protein